jgi:tRNA A37 threonylcarbamoyladenosine synthetase subunit TsaC/SUA5/YrdC
VDCTSQRPRVLREGAIPAWLIAETLERHGHGHDIRG